MAGAVHNPDTGWHLPETTSEQKEKKKKGAGGERIKKSNNNTRAQDTAADQ